MRYGFDQIYPKLRWLDKITCLEIACSMKPAYLNKIVDKVACDLMYSEYDEIHLQLMAVIQALGIFNEIKYMRQELWVKLEQILIHLYD